MSLSGDFEGFLDHVLHLFEISLTRLDQLELTQLGVSGEILVLGTVLKHVVQLDVSLVQNIYWFALPCSELDLVLKHVIFALMNAVLNQLFNFSGMIFQTDREVRNYHELLIFGISSLEN